MKKFFQTGMAFIVVALLCLIAGVICFIAGKISNSGTAFSLGMFWLIIAIIIRNKNIKNQPAPKNPGG